MKVLYIGNYRDGTGWANACAGNILALDAVDLSVVPRAISFQAGDQDYPDRIKELEHKHRKRSSNCDCNVVVQHTLPHLYCYHHDYKNIGFFDTESSDFSVTGWQYSANMMDEIWVPSQQNLEAAQRSGVTVPIKIVPHSIDSLQYQEVEGEKIKEMEQQFTFGFVGEFIERKNIAALVKAFHITFDPTEPANLFLKTSRADLGQVQDYCTHIKRGLKIRRDYKEEIIVSGIMPKQDYVSVLNQVNRFVMPSRGEAFCIPALEAMTLGIPCLYTEGIGMDFCIGQAIESRLTPCFGAVDTLPDVDTAATMWLEIDVLKLSKAMRKAYNMWNTPEESELKEACLGRASRFSHRQTGTTMKELLSDC
jgi:glycosyltransferase involved in cell wall biosynthesis